MLPFTHQALILSAFVGWVLAEPQPGVSRWTKQGHIPVFILVKNVSLYLFLFCKVCMHVCPRGGVHMCVAHRHVCRHMHAQMCIWMWVPEADFRCLLPLCSVLFIEARSLAEPGVCHFRWSGWPVCPQGFLSSTYQVLGWQEVSLSAWLLRGAENQTPFLTPVTQCVIYWVISPILCSFWCQNILSSDAHWNLWSSISVSNNYKSKYGRKSHGRYRKDIHKHFLMLFETGSWIAQAGL